MIAFNDSSCSQGQSSLNFGFRAHQESGIDDVAANVIIDISPGGPGHDRLSVDKPQFRQPAHAILCRV
jgi:hypothetical protein